MKTIFLTKANGQAFRYTEEEFNNLKEGGMLWEVFPDAPEFFPEETHLEGLRYTMEESMVKDALYSLEIGIGNTKDLLAAEESKKDVDSRKNQLYIKTLKSDIVSQQSIYDRISDIVYP